MKVIVAPNAFKESLTAMEACEAIERGIKHVFPYGEVVKIPVSDGGDGLVGALVQVLGGDIIHYLVTGPLGNQVKASLGLLNKSRIAIVEMAQASGLIHVPVSKRDPLRTTSYGTGELIKHALDLGVEKIIIGLGGSATVDGGLGMTEALGGHFTDEMGDEIGRGGGALAALSKINLNMLDSRLKKVVIEVACDVDNPLTGPHGAAKIYAPQKGAGQQEVKILEKNLKHLAKIIKKDLKVEINNLPGAGAAGGLGAGLAAFLGIPLKSGAEIILNLAEVREHFADSHLVITGEGCIDSQTLHGKAPLAVARLARKLHVPVIAIGGQVSLAAETLADEFDALYSLYSEPRPLKEALKTTADNLEHCARSILSTVKIGKLI